MAITQAFTTGYKQDLFDGVHAPGNTYKIALYESTAALDAATTAYTATGEVTGTGYTAGGQALTGRLSLIDGTKAILTFDNASWADSTITARGALIYNDTVVGKNALVVLDFGSDVSSTNGTFTVTMPTANATSGLIRVA